MGCFFQCFRVRDVRQPQSHLVAAPIHAKSRAAGVSGNQLAFLFHSDDSLSKHKEDYSCDSLQPSGDDKELNDEARLLKACGTLLETPTEIRKATTMLDCSPSHNQSSDLTKFHSWFPDTSISDLNSNGQLPRVATTVKPCEPHKDPTPDGSPSSCMSDSKPVQNLSPFKTVKKETPHREKVVVEASTSPLLKPFPGKEPPIGRTPGDRPIMGTVATYWNEDEPPNVSPKWWDGNGIPNSTNKYKEDQRVKWHATPFEERLEKALSEESLISQRGRSGTPVSYDENEEYDTAMSKANSSVYPKVVVLA